jgi:hypothetical protein
MFTPPDKRAIYIIGVLVAVGIAYLLTPFESKFSSPLERLLCVAAIVAGIAFAILDVRGGYCLNRPNITREESPFMFWVEVVGSLVFAAIGAMKLWSN